MVTTRSGAKPKKIKFSDEDFKDEELPIVDNQEKSEKQVIPEANESDDDSDAAPEEESISSGKKSALQKEKERLKAEQEEKLKAKEKRRQLNEFHAQQQQQKKVQEVESLPDLLPENIMDEINTPKEDDSDNEQENYARKHLKMTDFEDMEKKELARQIKEEKLRKLRLLNKPVIKKGVVRVKVSSNDIKQVNKKLVPRAEHRVVNSRDKWLKRKSLQKK